jgi:hypothetical protein
MGVFQQLWNYSKLARHAYALHREYELKGTVQTPESERLIDVLHEDVLQCGAICIKFAQWLLPILDNIYIKDKDKPYWFTSLEDLYENCPTHSDEYTKQTFQDEFGETFDDNYTLLDIIGSGSIGQVYKIRNKHTDKVFAFKVIHPNVSNEVTVFTQVLKALLYIPCIRTKLYALVPVDYTQFIHNFKGQVNMIHEANHLSRMSYQYNDNQSVIIPQLIRCSSSCLIMTYEDGDMMDALDLTQYQKTKIITLLFGFISSNQLFDDIMHNDIHKANWKIRKVDENRYSLVIYDFGFCYTKRVKDRPIIGLICELCETSDENHEADAESLIQVIQFFINDTSDCTRDNILSILPTEFKADPIQLFDLTIELCRVTNRIVDTSAFQILITSIQTYQYLKDAGINNGHNLQNDRYRMYRERYLDLCNIYTTYDCFHEFRGYMVHKLNAMELKVDGLFDVIDDNGTTTDELRALLSFDS